MPIGAEALIPLGTFAMLMLLGGKKKKRKARREPQCPPFAAVDIDDVAEVAQLAVSEGLAGVDQVSAHVATVLYPVDQNGKTIPWPKAPPFVLPPDAPDAVVCLFAEIKLIVGQLPGIPEGPVVGPPKPGQILTNLIAKTPTPGKFFLLFHKGPNALGKSGVAGQALDKVLPGAGSNSAHRVKLLHLMSEPGTWNIEKYGRDKFTEKWPAWTGVEGRNIGTAWLDRHKRAISAITMGKMPQRNIDIHGNKIGPGSSYGLIWIPPISKQSLQNLGVVSTDGAQWPGGGSVLNPPTELLSLLTD